MKYDIDYFINKFENIEEDKWWTNSFHDFERTKFCALGHCGRDFIVDTQEAKELVNIAPLIVVVNDFPVYGSTPKSRVINYLKDLKNAT